jgi:hypothetical protein
VSTDDGQDFLEQADVKHLPDRPFALAEANPDGRNLRM